MNGLDRKTLTPVRGKILRTRLDREQGEPGPDEMLRPLCMAVSAEAHRDVQERTQSGAAVTNFLSLSKKEFKSATGGESESDY